MDVFMGSGEGLGMQIVKPLFKRLSEKLVGFGKMENPAPEPTPKPGSYNQVPVCRGGRRLAGASGGARLLGGAPGTASFRVPGSGVGCRACRPGCSSVEISHGVE